MSEKKTATEKTTAEHLNDASGHLFMALSSLQDALRNSKNVEGLMILQLTAKTAQLKIDVRSLQGAMEGDQ